MNINPFIELFSTVLYFLKTSLVIYIILEWLIAYNIINLSQPVVYRVSNFLNRVFNPTLEKIRIYLKPIAGIDLSPIVLFLFIRFVDSALYTYFYKF